MLRRPRLIWVRVLPASTPLVSTATGTLESVIAAVAELATSYCAPQQYALPALSSAHVI